MATRSTQTFFAPVSYSNHDDQIPLHTYSLAHTLLNRVKVDHIFVPIPSMKYFAVIEPDVIWFIDSMHHAIQDGEAGRMITISWKPEIPFSQQESQEQPVPCTVTFHGEDQEGLQNQLQSELPQAMEQLEQRYQGKLPTAIRPRIIPYTRTDIS